MHAFRVSPQKTHQWLKDEMGSSDRDDPVIMPCAITLKPLLTPEHKVQHTFFAILKLCSQDHHFHGFYDSIHLDEKWFFLREKQLRLYMATDEEQGPERFIKNKDHITNVMFLCAIACLHYDNNSGVCCLMEISV